MSKSYTFDESFIWTVNKIVRTKKKKKTRKYFVHAQKTWFNIDISYFKYIVYTHNIYNYRTIVVNIYWWDAREDLFFCFFPFFIRTLKILVGILWSKLYSRLKYPFVDYYQPLNLGIFLATLANQLKLAFVWN